MAPETSSASAASGAPATNNPGLARYLAHLFSGAVLMLIFSSFMAVHLYYASSALLDLIVLLILFFLLAFVGLSVSSLVMATMTGPGELPSRFSAARMDTFIQEELQHAVATAQAAAHTTAAPSAPSSTGVAKSGALTTGNGAIGSGGVNGGGAAVRGTNWADVDAADGQQLANVAAAAAMAQRGSAAAEAAVLERAAAEARLRGYHHNIDDTTSASEHSDGDGREMQAGPHHRRSRRGDGERDEDGEGDEDGAPAPAELPPYMTEAMQLRRLRKLRRGLPLTTVSAVAQRVLAAMEGTDMGRKQEELSFLLPGANWCRFCRFYQMNDTRHCDVCGRCVYRSNVHSSCCGTCIGYANSKYYVLFLWYLCLALVTADVLDLYCVSWGYTFFFKSNGDTNSIYYLVFVYSASFAIAGFGFVVHYLYAVGRGIGFLTDLLQEQRAELAERRVSNNGAVYEPIIMDSDAAVHPSGGAGGPVDAHDPAARSASPMAAETPFRWRRVADAIGEGLPLPLWFWPAPTRPAVPETADPPGYWEALRDAIRMRLRSVADEDDVFGDDDDIADSPHDGAPHPTTTTTASASSGVAASAAMAATTAPATAVAAAAPHPPRAKSGDTATAVVVPMAAVQQQQQYQEEEPPHALLPTSAVSPSPPPAAKVAVAPAPKRKAD